MGNGKLGFYNNLTILEDLRALRRGRWSPKVSFDLSLPGGHSQCDWLFLIKRYATLNYGKWQGSVF
jgi:hypothetical protein